MTGRTVFEQLMQDMINRPHKSPYAGNLTITQKQFDEWQKLAAWDIMQGLRYGQSFCNHFGLTDNILYYEFSWLSAEEYIKRTYVEKS